MDIFAVKNDRVVNKRLYIGIKYFAESGMEFRGRVFFFVFCFFNFFAFKFSSQFRCWADDLTSLGEFMGKK